MKKGDTPFASIAFAFSFSVLILHSALSGGENITPSEQENLHFFMPCNSAKRGLL